MSYIHHGDLNIAEEYCHKAEPYILQKNQRLDASTIKYFLKLDLINRFLVVNIQPRGSFDRCFHGLQNGTFYFVIE